MADFVSTMTDTSSITISNSDGTPPFDATLHLKTPPMSDEHKLLSESVLATLRGEHAELFTMHEQWLTADDQVSRFLIARSHTPKPAMELLLEALKWRTLRRPDRVIDEEMWEWLSQEVDKYVVFVHLNTFSIFNAPGIKSTLETLQMLSRCFPERMGHCVAFCPPLYFYVVWESVKGFLDPKTVSKVVFITGDVSEGSKNDIQLKTIIGDDWKKICGAGQSQVPGNSPGFDHSDYWPKLKGRVEGLRVAPTI
mmetsp:Transcript_21539/g.46678  ORF Transcript_21539/g.46678 Transcript_21539/m.46678 type:complete len:253 (+) Transcript_21539:155-913(+)|eukprot:CAMPEP_0173206804 /NCGR_PEP_ID=MMETSP1141-20130122/21568_1 /TAXON_ID=483371 /ORGANISM="non described non described, Strain CCMP2298" /LENGTH=252 /DNA_ID=CAMNT_0014132993 /DNA_START=66 /DNA_END=824 /DNA_ORIENTATION=-